MKILPSLLYKNRAERNRMLADFLAEAKRSGKILNVGGGGERHLEKALASTGLNLRIIELDIVGDCDLILNLDQIKKLPYDTEEFDVVCCMDVLEHLENLHLVNSELIRVAKRKVIISLPVSTSEIVYNMLLSMGKFRGYSDRGVHSKFYGLPLEKPKDRHRWWISYDDIVRFYREVEKNNTGLRVKFLTPKLTIKRKILRHIIGVHLYNNFFVPHVWIVIDKAS